MSRERGVSEVVNIDTDERVENYFNMEYSRSALVDGVDLRRTKASAIYTGPEAALNYVKRDKAFSRFLLKLAAGFNGAFMGLGGFMATDGVIKALSGNETATIVGLIEAMLGTGLFQGGMARAIDDCTGNAATKLRENIARRSVEEKAIEAFLQQKNLQE